MKFVNNIGSLDELMAKGWEPTDENVLRPNPRMMPCPKCKLPFHRNGMAMHVKACPGDIGPIPLCKCGCGELVGGPFKGQWSEWADPNHAHRKYEGKYGRQMAWRERNREAYNAKRREANARKRDSESITCQTGGVGIPGTLPGAPR